MDTTQETPEPNNSSNPIALFLPRKGFAVTPVIIAINVLVFVVMVISGVHFMMPNTESLVAWGADFGPYTLSGEWWRLFTSTYIHIGIIHLAMNMYALLYIGNLLEPILGKVRFMAAYTIAGILGSVASIWWNDVQVSAGASGAIFGMYGVFLALLTTNIIKESARKSLLGSIGVFVIFNLAYGFRDSNVDNAAHIGGLLSGLLIGFAMLPGIKNPKNAALKYGSILLPVVVGLGVSYALLNGRESDFAKYETAMDEFAKHEAIAVEKFPPDSVSWTDRFQVLANIKAGTDEWQKCLDVLHEIENMKLNDNLQQRNTQLLEYTTLRHSAFELLYKKYETGTTEYDTVIDNKLAKADEIVKKINEEGETDK